MVKLRENEIDNIQTNIVLTQFNLLLNLHQLILKLDLLLEFYLLVEMISTTTTITIIIIIILIII